MELSENRASPGKSVHIFISARSKIFKNRTILIELLIARLDDFKSFLPLQNENMIPNDSKVMDFDLQA